MNTVLTCKIQNLAGNRLAATRTIDTRVEHANLLLLPIGHRPHDVFWIHMKALHRDWCLLSPCGVYDSGARVDVAHDQLARSPESPLKLPLLCVHCDASKQDGTIVSAGVT